MYNVIDKIMMYFEEHQLERYIPWNRRSCKYCLYPLSEKYMLVYDEKGRERNSYCCNVCYELRENQPTA